MKNSNKFNVSDNNPEAQKKRDYEKHQLKIQEKRINQHVRWIDDSRDKRHAETMINNRDHVLEVRRDLQDANIALAQDLAVEKNKAGRLTHEMPSPYGTTGQVNNTERREDVIRTQVRQKMEQKFDPENREFEREANRKIEEFVERTLENQRKNAPDQKPAQELSFKEKLRQSARDSEPKVERKEEMGRNPFSD